MIGGEKVKVNKQVYKLVARMVVAGMVGQYSVVQELYERYLRERYLYVSIQEILEAKERMAG